MTNGGSKMLAKYKKRRAKRLKRKVIRFVQQE